jgi:uncharacterized membrane protein
MSTLHHTTAREAVDHPDVVNLHTLERYLSAAGGAYLTICGVRRGFRGGSLHMLIGAELMRRALSGHSYTYQAFGVRTAPQGAESVPYEQGVHVQLAFTIAKPRNEVYAFWRRFSNLPRVMRYLTSVDEREGGVTRWTMKGPMGMQVHWDAEIVTDVENEKIAWRSLPESQVASAGTVQFKDAPGHRGTEVRIHLQYCPPAGYVGAYGAKLFGRDARSAIEADCWRLKQYLETGEIATTEGQPHGQSDSHSRRDRRQTESRQPVEVHS